MLKSRILQSFICSTYHTSTSPAVLPIPRARPGSSSDERHRCSSTRGRGYATVRRTTSYDFRDSMNWPCHRQSKPSGQPSPYDIFDLEHGAAYSKQKFYELVKVYHPDRHNSAAPEEPIHTLSALERIERYRLVVQAHEILSDPVRRKAYDATGAGWGGNAPRSTGPRDGPFSYNADHPESPFGNATWEDWERWYAKTSHPHASGPQRYQGAYINHNIFASFIIFTAILTGILQAVHAGSSATGVEERALAFTAQTHQFLNERQGENKRYSSEDTSHGLAVQRRQPVFGPASENRIRHFLERRDPNRYGLKDEEESHYRLHFSGKNDASLLKPASERPQLPAPNTNDER
jgi:curved DNA-binding protein CbpA